MVTGTIRNPFPYRTEVVDISRVDVTFTAPFPQAIRSDADGVVYARYVGDDTFRRHTVAAGSYLPGYFAAVQRVGTTVTGEGSILACWYPEE